MPIALQLDEEVTPSWIEPELFDELSRDTVEQVLREEMSLLPLLYAAVMELFYGEECSYEQIVKITGMPLGTVKTRLNRGRTLLRTALLKRCPDLELSNA